MTTPLMQQKYLIPLHQALSNIHYYHPKKMYRGQPQKRYDAICGLLEGYLEKGNIEEKTMQKAKDIMYERIFKKKIDSLK